ncbi:MAG: hypothetical protein HY719_09130 [Planctomycetes bacterium]|nr:hypothetical protein [Planctomycetota bacterium]
MGFHPGFICSDDFNGDGKIDVAVVERDPATATGGIRFGEPTGGTKFAVLLGE